MNTWEWVKRFNYLKKNYMTFDINKKDLVILRNTILGNIKYLDTVDLRLNILKKNLHEFILEIDNIKNGGILVAYLMELYGMIVMQGHGTFGGWNIETPALIRYGQLTHDEYFVSEKAGKTMQEDWNAFDIG